MSLSDAFRASLAKNEVVQQGLEQINQLEARADQVQGGMYPHIGVNVIQLMQPSSSDALARSFSPPQQTTMSVSVAQPLFRGLRDFKEVSQLEHLKDAQKATQEAILSRLYQDVAASYLQILSLEQDLKNLQEQADLYQKRITELGARAQRGESNQTDVVSAEATRASLAAEIRLIEGQREAARETFHFLTGVSRDALVMDPKLVSKNAKEPLEKYLERVEKRPDVRAAIERVEASRDGVSAARGWHWPTLDLVGNYYVVRPSFLAELNWDVSLRLTLPIFEGGVTDAKVEEALSKQKETELELERTRRAARQEIRSLYEKLRARVDHVAHLENSADLSRKNTVLIQRDYRRGLARNIDVQLALTEHRIAQRSFDQAHFAAQLEMIQLQAAVSQLPTDTATKKDN